jgi:hypothetical protein
MKELLIEDLKAITEASSAPMISIYLSRDPRLDTKTLPERWKQSLSKAESFLLKDYTRSFVHMFMEPLRHATFFSTLETLDKGIIIFYSTEQQSYMRVQTNINDLVVVADSFHIKPLLRIKNTERGYFVIGVSPRLISLSVETNGHLYRLDSIRNPGNVDSPKKNANRDFFSQTAALLNKSLNQYRLPVILLGAKEYLDQMRKFLNSSYVLEDVIIGNSELMAPEEIRENSFEILEPYYHQKELEAIQDLNLAVKNNQAITYIEDIAVSAVYGKIKKLFVIENKQVWGKMNRQTGEIFISPKQVDSHDDDILDDISQIVLAKGGEVVVLKDATNVKGYIAAAIVTDTSHLYDYNQNYTSPGL